MMWLGTRAVRQRIIADLGRLSNPILPRDLDPAAREIPTAPRR